MQNTSPTNRLVLAVLAIFNKISPVRMVSNASRCNNCGRCDVECSMGIQSVPENLRTGRIT